MEMIVDMGTSLDHLAVSLRVIIKVMALGLQATTSILR
jgi:hypothetical protein